MSDLLFNEYRRRNLWIPTIQSTISIDRINEYDEHDDNNDDNVCNNNCDGYES